MKTIKKILHLVLWVGVFLTISTFIGMVSKTHTSSAWYHALNQSPLRPPNFIFGIVWPILYTLIAYSGWLIWSAPRTPALKRLYIGQMLLNWSWMHVFFIYRMTGLALLSLMAMVVIVAALIVACWRTVRMAGMVLIPYFLWLVFALHLNWYIWMHN